MNISLVISSLSCGGAERVMSTIANTWAQRGENVTLISFDSADNDFYELHSSTKRVALELSQRSDGLWNSIGGNFTRLRQLRAAIRQSKPDVIISFLDRTNVLTLIASTRLGIPVIVSERTDPREYSPGRMWTVLRRLTYPSASAVVVQTYDLRDAMLQIVPKQEIHVIPNPAPSGKVGVRKQSELVFSAPFVLAMGRLSPEKGFDLLLNAYALCSNHTWSLVILGEGPERQRLESLAVQLGIRGQVQMPGNVKDPGAILDSAELFVLSSRFEGFPNSLMEAMSFGRAAISFDCPTGPRHIIRHGENGLLVPCEDYEALAAEMNRLMGDEKERRRLGNQARKVSERYSIERIIGLWDKASRDVLS